MRQTSSLDMTLWVVLSFHSLKHTHLMCQREKMDVIEGWTLLYKFVAEGFAVVFTVAKFPENIYFGVMDRGSFVVASVLTITSLVSVINAAVG